MFMRDDRILQQLEIKIMMDVYETVLANTSPSYYAIWVILTLSKIIIWKAQGVSQ